MKLQTAIPALFIYLIILFPPAAWGTESRTLSVLYYESLDRQAEYIWMEKGIADSLLTELSGIEGLVLVEREQLQKVITELKLQLSGLTDNSKAAEFGLLLNADRLLTGSYSVQGGVLRINCRAIETETGKVVFSLSKEDAVNNFSRLIYKIAVDVSLNLGFEKAPVIMNVMSDMSDMPEGKPSFAALTYYYQGLDLYDQGKYLDAIDLMEKSRIESPGFIKPSLTLEECYRFLNDFRKARQLRELNQLYEELDLLTNRLNRRPFLTYGEVLSRAAAAGEDIMQLNEKLKKDISWFRGETQAQVYWNIQLTMFRIAQELQNNFNNHHASEIWYRRITLMADNAEELFHDDPSLAEIFYQKILSHYMLKDWVLLENACFSFMGRWPDFRMIAGVEGFYEKALDKRGTRQAGIQ